MIRLRKILIIGLALGTMMSVARAQSNEQTQSDIDVEDLGDERYRIGQIIVDRASASFSVPGRVAHLDDPLEYIAVAEGGVKEYESLLELKTSADEFQLACILIGLDDAEAVKPRYQFDERTVVGQPVSIDVSWESDDETRMFAITDVLSLQAESKASADWVYIGSFTAENGEFMASMIGTLIGFVHDPYAIIEHRNGLAIGAYGMITGNASLLPPEGSAVTLSVSVKAEKLGEKQPEKTAENAEDQ